MLASGKTSLLLVEEMVLTDIHDLFCELKKKYTCKEIARHFGRGRKWTMFIADGSNIVLNAEFIAGLRHFGYDLKLVKYDKSAERQAEQLEGQMDFNDIPGVMP